MGDDRPIRVVLADDHIVVRHGLRMLLDSVTEISVVGEAGEAATAFEVAATEDADILVLDLNMPGKPPLDALTEAAGGTVVVVLTMERDPAFARRALELGASGYVLKDAVDDELVDAIRAVAGGDRHVSQAVAAALEEPDDKRAPGGLTERETEILRLIALGHTSGEIAADLSLSVRTVESHRKHIQQKLGLSSRPELVRHALDQRLI
jgi:two-component system, NarL family, response regulator NreC